MIFLSLSNNIWKRTLIQQNLVIVASPLALGFIEIPLYQYNMLSILNIHFGNRQEGFHRRVCYNRKKQFVNQKLSNVKSMCTYF